MEHNQPKPNMKSRRANDNKEQRSEDQRLELQNDSADGTTKITDVNDDCLVKIFSYLHLQCLFNLAIASEWLHPAAAIVYKRKFGTTTVQISRCENLQLNTSGIENPWSIPALEAWSQGIDVYGLRTALQYLRCFGPSINDLVINYNQSRSKRYSFVHQYVQKYCSESLTQLSFGSMPNMAINEFEKEFVNVEEVTLWYGSLGQQLATFIGCFPNLRRLELYGVNLVYGTVEKPFQRLEELTIGMAKPETKIADLLHLNRDLKSLDIESESGREMPMNKLLDMIPDNRSLVKLSVSNRIEFCRQPIQVEITELHRLANEHPLLVELHLYPYQFAVDDVVALVRQFNLKLENFIFVMRESEFPSLVSQLEGDGWTATKRKVYKMNVICSVKSH